MEIMGDTPYILYLPDIALEKIFSYLSYDEIAKNRIVCRRFNQVGSKMLSRGFLQLQKRHSAIYKRVKSLVPRRESERRVHPLSRHCDILQAVETRLSMLNMTYKKYIERNLLCFIPGKVLDEIINVLNMVESDYTPPRTHQLLQELRDLSSMAMEHFDEHILPSVKENKEQMDDWRQVLNENSPYLPTKQPKFAIVQHMVNGEVQKIKKQCKVYKHNIANITQVTQELFKKIKKQNLRIEAQSVLIRDQERKIQEQTTKIQEQENCLNDIKKHIDEWDQKYKDLATELVRTREEILSQQSLTPPIASTSSNKNDISCATLPSANYFRSTIKPRKAQILIPNLKIIDTERKRKSTNLLPDIPLKLTKNVSGIGGGGGGGGGGGCNEQGVDKTQNFLERDKNEKRDFSFFIKSPVSRKRKLNEDIDLK